MNGNELLARCKAIAPNLTRIDPNLVADLLERIDRTEGAAEPTDTHYRTSDAADNYASILAAGETTAATSLATLFAIGERNELRADHLRIVDRRFASENVSGTARPADPYTSAVTSAVQVKRSKRGQYKRVVRYGQTLVTGRTEIARGGLNPDNVGLEHALEQCRRGHGLYDGLAVAHIATAVYDLPDLIGAELRSFSEVLPADVSSGLRGSFAAWTTGPYDDGTTRHTYRRVKYPTRLRLPALRARKGESLAARTVDNVTRLVSPAADTEHAFVGHRRYPRPAARSSARKARVYRETFTLAGDPQSALAIALGATERGTAARWHVPNGPRGTLSVSPSGRFNVTIDGRSDLAVRSARSIRAAVTAAGELLSY